MKAIEWRKRLRSALKNFFIQSSQIHLRQHPANTPSDLVDLMDRFLGDGPMRYPLEWDDFISWKQPNPNIEAVRIRLSQNERLLFSRSKMDRELYGYVVIEERNRLAAILGLPPRAPVSSSVNQHPRTPH